MAAANIPGGLEGNTTVSHAIYISRVVPAMVLRNFDGEYTGWENAIRIPDKWVREQATHDIKLKVKVVVSEGQPPVR